MWGKHSKSSLFDCNNFFVTAFLRHLPDPRQSIFESSSIRHCPEFYLASSGLGGMCNRRNDDIKFFFNSTLDGVLTKLRSELYDWSIYYIRLAFYPPFQGPTISCASSILRASIQEIASSRLRQTWGCPLSLSFGVDMDPSRVMSRLQRMLFRRYSKQWAACIGLSSSLGPFSINWW